jgi:nitrite reductase (NO-forming)
MQGVRINHDRVIGEKARVPTWPKSAVRIAFGVVWAIDAAFKWRPGFHKEFLTMINKAGEGQPNWLHWWFKFWSETITPHPHVWAYGIASIETLIAAALILGFARKVTYIVTIITSLAIWSIAEGFGGPYTATSTDVGAAIMYAFVGASLLVLSLQCGPSRYSVDYYIEKRVSWWHWVAEFGAHNHPVPIDKPSTPIEKPSTTHPQPAGRAASPT